MHFHHTTQEQKKTLERYLTTKLKANRLHPRISRSDGSWYSFLNPLQSLFISIVLFV